jgi:hypothetical protein
MTERLDTSEFYQELCNSWQLRLSVKVAPLTR